MQVISSYKKQLFNAHTQKNTSRTSKAPKTSYKLNNLSSPQKLTSQEVGIKLIVSYYKNNSAINDNPEIKFDELDKVEYDSSLA
jgi:hypothetical protein